jgi:hypothetical protein
LLVSGFDRAGINLLAREEAVADKLGHKYKKVEEIEDDDAAPRADYVDVESLDEAKGSLIGGLFYIGAFAAAGAILASGGVLIGAVLGEYIDKHHANYLSSAAQSWRSLAVGASMG